MIKVISDTLVKLRSSRDQSNYGYIDYIARYIRRVKNEYSYNYYHDLFDNPITGLSHDLYDEIDSILQTALEKIIALEKKYN